MTVGAYAARAFLNVCGETPQCGVCHYGRGREMHWGDLSAMLAATVKTMVAGELGRADEVSLTATFVRAVGAAPPSTGLLLRPRRGAQHGVAVAGVGGRGRCGQQDPRRRSTVRCLSLGRDDDRVGQPSRAHRFYGQTVA